MSNVQRHKVSSVLKGCDDVKVDEVEDEVGVRKQEPIIPSLEVSVSDRHKGQKGDTLNVCSC